MPLLADEQTPIYVVGHDIHIGIDVFVCAFQLST